MINVTQEFWRRVEPACKRTEQGQIMADLKQIKAYDGRFLPGYRAPSELCLPEKTPIDIEIGCGTGLHPALYAKLNPDRYLIAIEHTKMRFEKFSRRLAALENPLPNLLPVHANAISWITELVPDASINNYFLMYPNPWPKKKHLNQRWHAMPFMEKILQTLKDGGQITIVTNEKFYFEEAKEYLQHHWGLTLASTFEFNQTELPPNFPRTHFEKKYIESGQSCYQLTAVQQKTK